MKVSDFYYELPEELIAQEPIEKRDESRLLVLHKTTGEIEHKIFKEILHYLDEGDCLVLNNTKVIPARLIGEREDSHGKMEFVLLKRLSLDTWEVLVKPGRRAKIGSRFVFGGGKLKAEVIDRTETGERIVKFIYDGVFEDLLDELGKIPLPPYIKKQLKDKDRYQTVYAKYEGSAAAPTAGLHFTDELLKEIERKGVRIAYVTLHVGLGTFRPIKVENVLEHKMHSEYYELNEETAELINRTKLEGKRVFAVGTTTIRTLETVMKEEGFIKPKKGWTDLFIYPGFEFKIVDALVTNFHLPCSTLLMLVSAFAGRDKIFKAYEEAIRERYRFFSFGDAMLIL